MSSLSTIFDPSTPFKKLGGQDDSEKEKLKRQRLSARLDKSEGERLANIAGRSLLGDAGLGGSLQAGRPGGVGGGTLLGG